MIQSMTGYGAAERDCFKVEVRSLNHRYLDISVKMPSVLLEHEIPIRNMIKEKFTRGKFDVVVTLTQTQQVRVRINRDMAREIYGAISALQKELNIPGHLSMDFIVAFKELLLSEEAAYCRDTLLNVLKETLVQVEEMRRKEGAHLRREMEKNIDRLEHIHGEVKEFAKDLGPRHRETLLRRIAELTENHGIDETRLVQEVVLMVQKSDVSEEITRFASHIEQSRHLLAAGGGVGRKFDFLLQEMNRETNTIAAKVDDFRMISATTELKTEIEKLREQAQNIQ